MKSFSLPILAETVLARRKALHMTQQDLSSKTLINRSLLSRLEKQDYVPSPDQLIALANVLGFDLSLVFPETEEPAPAPETRASVTVYGAGYVGLSIAVLLARHHHVTLVDVIPEKVDLVNRRTSPIQDEYIEKYMAEEKLDLTATLDGESACRGADFVVIAAPPTTIPSRTISIPPPLRTSLKPS